MKENTLRKAVQLALWLGMAFGLVAAPFAQAQDKARDWKAPRIAVYRWRSPSECARG